MLVRYTIEHEYKHELNIKSSSKNDDVTYCSVLVLFTLLMRMRTIASSSRFKYVSYCQRDNACSKTLL